MPSICWFESFLEEETTVKQITDRADNIRFFEGPVQDVNHEKIPDNSIYTVRTHSQFDRRHRQKAACVISRSTGYDHLLEQEETLKGLPVGSISEYATQAVADHNVSAGLALIKRFPEQARSIREFDRSRLTGKDIDELSPGVIGVGKIGTATVERLNDIGLEVFGHDIEQKPGLVESGNFHYCSLEKVFGNCDLIFLCLPHTDKTEELITPTLLGKLPETSFLVNSGRGEVVRNQDLLEALQEGPLAGLALDVFNQEKELVEHLRHHSFDTPAGRDEVQSALELIEDPRVLATPHNAFNSKNSLLKKVQLTLDNVRTFVEENRVLTPVDWDQTA